MKTMKKAWLLLLLSPLALEGCHNSTSAPKSDSSEDSSGVVSGDSTGSATGSETISQSSSSGQDDEDYGPDVVFNGLVKIYYHNDDASVYANKRLWAWGNGVNGAEYTFDNQSTPDTFGLYKVFDMSGTGFVDFEQNSMRFIIKNAGTWSGQTPDIVTGFNKYIKYKTTQDGRDLLTIYCVDDGTSVLTYNKSDDALGDRISGAEFKDWRTIACSGTGTPGTRATADVGKCASYSLYAYPHEYWTATAEEQATMKASCLLVSGTPDSNAWTITLNEDVACTNIYSLECAFALNTSKIKKRVVSWLKLYDSSLFRNNYTYNDSDLGYHLTEGKNVFKLWAPTAGRVQLNIYNSGMTNALRGSHDLTDYDTPFATLEMTYGTGGVWSYTDSEDYTNKFYTYSVITTEGSSETIDPYARSSGVNGIRGAILSDAAFDATDPKNFATSLSTMEANDPITRPNQLSVYEVHIRDFTADKSWVSNKGNKNGTYAAFAEEGTTYTENGVTVKTGFDSLKELAPKAIQILPIFDADNDERTYTSTSNGATILHTPDYNWGYNPLNYNVVDGVYSANPKSATTKITELKNIVKACADNGIRVIMDVVYNHMASTANNAFNKVMPKYYFLTNEAGYYYDETGCNNTIATGRKMVKNFMVDSVKWWATEYGIKGFRFDLMGAIESATMRAIKDALYDYDPQIVVYGEGWRVSGDSTTQSTTNVVYTTLGDKGKGSVGCFNAGGRDGLKGETQDGHPAYGFMSQGLGDFTSDTMYNAACTYLGEDRYTTQNGIATPPAQTVNYVACHDNYTLYDSFKWCDYQGTGASADIVAAQQATLATSAYVLMGQGIAFFQGGEELYRTKLIRKGEEHYDDIDSGDCCVLSDGVKMVRNGYKYGDGANSFKWNRKVTFNADFQKFAEAFKKRNELVKEGYLGVDYSAIQGTYTSGGTSYKYSRLWDDMINTSTNLPKYAVLPAQTEFSKISGSSLNDFYTFLGGRMSAATSSIGIGNGTLEVLYDSTGTHAVGSSLSVSDYTLAVGKYECLIVRRTA